MSWCATRRPKWPARLRNGAAGEISVNTMTGDVLNQMARGELFRRKADAIKSLAANNEVLLTNPDIFHYISQFFYAGAKEDGDSTDVLFGR